MDIRRNKFKVPRELCLTAALSGGLTIVISVIYSVLCIIALVYRFQCNSGLAVDATGDKFFVSTLYRIYIQADSCDNPDSTPPEGVLLMTADTVFIFVITILGASVLTCVAAIVLILVIFVEERARYIFASSWAYICICLSSLVVDITFAVFFGLDYSEIASYMNAYNLGHLRSTKWKHACLLELVVVKLNDVLRLGSLLFMTISLKGYLAPVINIILLVLLAYYANKYRTKLQTDEHSIHKIGVINAYEPQTNLGFVPDEEPRRSPRSPVRTIPLTPLSDYSNNREYDRSTSWQPAHAQASRPFSYMEEPRRSPRTPSSEPQWRRDPWPPAPPVPAPDYSPPARRLKSALKTNYM